MRQNYELLMTEWLAVEAIVKIRDRENLTASLAKFNSEDRSVSQSNGNLSKDQDDVFKSIEKQDNQDMKTKANAKEPPNNFLIEKLLKDVIEEDENCDECKFEEELEENDEEADKNGSRSSSALKLNNLKRQRNVYTQSSQQSTVQYATNQILITDASVDLYGNTSPESSNNAKNQQEKENSESGQYLGRQNDSRNDGQLSADHSTCVSPASSNGGVYTVSIY